MVINLVNIGTVIIAKPLENRVENVYTVADLTSIGIFLIFDLILSSICIYSFLHTILLTTPV